MGGTEGGAMGGDVGGERGGTTEGEVSGKEAGPGGGKDEGVEHWGWPTGRKGLELGKKGFWGEEEGFPAISAMWPPPSWPP